MLFRDKIAAYCVNRTKHTNALSGQSSVVQSNYIKFRVAEVHFLGGVIEHARWKKIELEDIAVV
jgi:hypothetical protein